MGYVPRHQASMTERGIARLSLDPNPTPRPTGKRQCSGTAELKGPLPWTPAFPPMRVLDNHMFRLRMVNNYTTETKRPFMMAGELRDGVKGAGCWERKLKARIVDRLFTVPDGCFGLSDQRHSRASATATANCGLA